MYDDTALSKELTLLDVGYIYAWRRTAPMRLFYRVKDLDRHLFPTQEAPMQSSLKKTDPEAIQTEQLAQNQTSFTQNSSLTKKKSPCKTSEQPQNNPLDPNNLIDDSTIGEETKITVEEPIMPAVPNKKIQQECAEHIKSDDNLTVPHSDGMSVNCSIQYNNQTHCSNQTFNENLTITAMMESIGRNADTNEKTKSPPLTHPITQAPILQSKESCDQSELENKMNIEVNEPEADSNQIKAPVKENKEPFLSSVPIPSDVALPNKENSETIANSFLMTGTVLDNKVTAVSNETKPKTKAKKNPAAPGSAGGVAKKKKDALTTIQNNNNKVTDGTTTPAQPKKVRTNYFI